MFDKVMNNEQIQKTAQQPKQYTEEELKKLRKFIETVKNDETRSALACWGNHDDYSKGY